MAVAIAWLPGPAGTRRRVAKPSVEEPDAAEPARPDLWGARVSNDPGLPDPSVTPLMAQTVLVNNGWYVQTRHPVLLGVMVIILGTGALLGCVFPDRFSFQRLSPMSQRASAYIAEVFPELFGPLKTTGFPNSISTSPKHWKLRMVSMVSIC